MKLTFNSYITPFSFKAKQANGGGRYSTASQEQELQKWLAPLAENKKAKVPAMSLAKGINPNNNDVFDTFTKIDDVTRKIGFTKDEQAWDECLLEEIEEFKVARREYQLNPTAHNFDHMEEEMGDIFYTAASIAKDTEIDPKEAFKATNRKFFNRINIMELLSGGRLADCKGFEKRALWNAAKRKLYDAQSLHYNA